jgi:hypothetical protein
VSPQSEYPPSLSKPVTFWICSVYGQRSVFGLRFFKLNEQLFSLRTQIPNIMFTLRIPGLNKGVKGHIVRS